VTDDATWDALLGRLNRQSVDKNFAAYVDVPWDDPSFALDAADPRWELPPDHPLGGTEWYRAQPPEVRSTIGLHDVATKMKIGLQFENVLKRGLLEFAAELPNGSPAFRYAYHEVIEEAQHALMFQEFVNRTGFEVAGLSRLDRFGARQVVKLGRRFPEMFFMFVLGGEDPIDHEQRQVLRRRTDLHPLGERIMRIHVTEEARHLSFARAYLRRSVPRLSRGRRLALSIQAPLTLGVMAAMMLRPARSLVRHHGIPADVVRSAYGTPEARRQVVEALAKVRRLCDELGLLTPLAQRVWRRMGIADESPGVPHTPG
jgi:hypothetical protein